MINVALIGAGQLGSRHLQALALSEIPMNIEVVDPFVESLKVAKERFEQMPKNNNIASVKYFESIDELSEDIYFAIVATGANVRAKIVQNLLDHSKVTNILLEKVLFQKLEEYDDIGALLKEKQVQAWVNHPRRMFPFYQKLKQELSGNKIINIELHGGAWGMGTNGLHIIDLYQYLTNADDFTMSHSLDKEILESKRANYKEINGVIEGNNGEHSFKLICHKDNIPSTISISSDKMSLIIDEVSGTVKKATEKSGWKWVEENEKIIHFQSELTQKVLEDIYDKNECDLPKYDESKSLHIPFITLVQKHIEESTGEKLDLCPIT